MKKILKTVAVFLLVAQGKMIYSQTFERTTANLPEISDPLTILDKATGWTLQDNGIWISGKNYIPNENADFNRTNDPENKLGKHNFLKIELREVIVQGEQHMVMIVYSKGGYFEFETLREGWKSQEDVTYYVFKAGKLKQLLSDTATPGRTYAVNLDLFCLGKIKDYDKKTYLHKIANHIQRQSVLRYPPQFTLLMALMPVNTRQGKMIRMRFIEVFNKKSIYQRYFLPEYLPKLLSKFYYEIPYADFSQFVRKAPVYEDLIANPRTFLEYYRRGIAFFNRKNYYAAIADFEQAIQLAPNEKIFLVHAYLGNCYFHLKQYQRALQAYNDAVNAKPADNEFINDWVRVVYNRGLTHYELDDLNQACDDWHRAAVYGLPEAEKMVKKRCKRL